MPYKVLFIAVDSDALGGAKLGQAVVADMDIDGADRPNPPRGRTSITRRVHVGRSGGAVGRAGGWSERSEAGVAGPAEPWHVGGVSFGSAPCACGVCLVSAPAVCGRACGLCLGE